MDLSGFDSPGFNTSTKTATKAQPKSPYAKGLGGFLEKALPAIGSIGGAVGGTLLAPGAGTAVGGAGGAVLGQKLEDFLTHQHSGAGTYATQAAFGTLGGVGKGLGAVKGGVNALRAGEDIPSVANILRLGSKGAAAVKTEGTPGVLNQALVASQANAGKGMVGKVAQTADRVGQQAMISQTGAMSRGTAESALKNIGDLRDLGYNSFSKAAEAAPAITGSNGVGTIARQRLINAPNLGGVDTSSFVGNAKDILDKHVSLPDSSSKKILSLVQKTADRHGFEGNSGLYGKIGISHPSQLDGAIKDLQDAAYTNAAGTPERKALVDIVNSLKGPLDTSLGPNAVGDNVKEEMISALKTQGVDNPKLINAVKNANSYRDISQLESKFVTASKVAEEGQVNSLRGGVPGLAPSGKATLTGLANQAGGRAVEKTLSTGGNAISKLAGKTPGVAESIPQLAATTARKVGTIQGLIRAPGLLASQSSQNQQPQTAPSPQSSGDISGVEGLPGFQDPNAPANTSQSGTSGALSSDAIQEAILNDIATTGGKNISTLTSLYNTFASPAALKAQQGSLSATDQAKHDNINTALSSLDAAEANLLSAGGAKGPVEGQATKIPLLGQYINNPGTAYESTKIETATQLAKAITGGSRPAASVIEQYLHSLPSVTDSPKQAAAKLAFLRSQLSEQASNFGFNDLTQ